MRLAILAGAALLSSCSTWTRIDQGAFAITVGCNAIDYRQTTDGLARGYHETNPLLGGHPARAKIAAFKAVDLAGDAYLMDRFPEHRQLINAAWLLPCVAMVAHNHAIGAHP